ncbi:hypothetical protein [Fibrella forsythiae]|uniref:Uncharacterized protein n=1 Tax=Fibrella forsythiae TaxID=2817061 RepID=A0ABS3JUJ6_9BACT|nr:hypothetical protein [Fibrella forsythiae]MBO0952577.1 hypothetical protein [Fibrella forsythiae]
MAKPLIYLALVAALAASLVALRPADVLTDTGVTMANIEQAALVNLKADGSLYVEPSALMRRMARRIPTDVQAATVRALGKVVRTYVESDAFRQAYRQSLSAEHNVDETYSDEKIARREAEVGMVDETVDAQTVALRQTMSAVDPAMFYTMFKAQVPQLEAQAAAATSTERTQLTQEVADLKRMLAANAGKPAEFKKQYVAYQEQRLRKGGKQYEANASQELAAAKIHNAEYRKQKAALDAASDVRSPLRKQLRAFVALCDEVDFGAQLYASGSKQHFVNPAYERKPDAWKLLFRMGKVPTIAARQFAQEWLTALP